MRVVEITDMADDIAKRKRFLVDGVDKSVGPTQVSHAPGLPPLGAPYPHEQITAQAKRVRPLETGDWEVTVEYA